MNIGRTQKLITFYVILPAALVYLGLRFYAQFRHVDVYVSRAAPMPAELASGLHMEEHKIDPMVNIETPYEKAPDKILPPDEIARLRRAVAWGTLAPFIDSLTILNPTNVVARKFSKNSIREYWLVMEDGHWTIERETRSGPVQRFLPQ